MCVFREVERICDGTSSISTLRGHTIAIVTNALSLRSLLLARLAMGLHTRKRACAQLADEGTTVHARSGGYRVRTRRDVRARDVVRVLLDDAF